MNKSKKKRYLTKSKYKLGLECPTKLFYSGKPDTYADSNIDDPFLKALARGGFQVGALARSYFPGGVLIESQDHDEAIEQTNQRLNSNEDTTIFEAALRWNDLFVRVDILKKVGKKIELIEVKSKSFDPREENSFFDKNALKKNIHKLNADFAPYLYDVAFQTFVCSKAYPLFEVTSFLMMPNKGTVTSVEGLNQYFLLKQNDKGRTEVVIKPGLSKEKLGSEILVKVDINHVVHLIHKSANAERTTDDRCQALPYEEEILYFAKMYVEDKKIATKPGNHCKNCEFRTKPEKSQKSGFNECWQTEMGLKTKDLNEPLAFDIWNFRGAQKLIENNKLLMKDLIEDDLTVKEPKDSEPGISQSQRQWLQVEKVKSGDKEHFVDLAGLKAEYNSWKFPLHFIDFETTMVAIPFNKGRRPYEQIAFQFSHHIIFEDGRIEHADQYLNTKVGVFPNFVFVRELKRALEKDQGTIFRYAAHENTVLCQIHEQLRNSTEPDSEKLMSWIRTITTSTAKSAEPWNGERTMVDFCDMVKKYYYHPLTNGSNSIKKVLPAILNSSKKLKDRYSKPIYGSDTGIKSLNFLQKSWVEFDTDGSIKDPYLSLPSIYHGLNRHQLDLIMGEDELTDGGAAMTAYSMIQFTEMSEQERSAIYSALLRYCELDTLAMVMLYEYWAELLGISIMKKAA